MKKGFRETAMQILRIFADSRAMSEENIFCDVRAMIDDARSALSQDGEQIGIWESIELNAADRALSAGFSQLALIFIAKAWAVSQLKQEEYTFGINLLRDERLEVIKVKRLQEQARSSKMHAAEELAATEKRAAADLLAAQEKAASDLSLSQGITAEKLREDQGLEAQNLSNKNIDDAESLAKENLKELQISSANEAWINLYQRELEQVLSWASGGYSVEAAAKPAESFSDTVSKNREAATRKLKIDQKEAARKLLKVQEQMAEKLVKSSRVDAESLKESQQRVAIEILEKQVIKALRQKIADSRHNE